MTTEYLNNLKLKCDYKEYRKNDYVLGIQILSIIESRGECCLFLPGRWQNSSFWAQQDPERDVRIMLAMAGYMVVTIDYRTHFINQSPLFQLNLKGCGIKEFISDVQTTIESLISDFSIKHGFIMGFSFGAALAFFSYYSQIIAEWSKGLIIIDGGIKDPFMQHNFNLEKELYMITNDNFIENPAVDISNNDSVPNRFKGLYTNRLQDPDFVNLLKLGDRLWPRKVITEMQAISDYKLHPLLAYDKALEKITDPLLYFYAPKTTCRKPHKTPFTVNLTQSRKIDGFCLVDWEHMDVLFSLRSKEQVFKPILQWLKTNS